MKKFLKISLVSILLIFSENKAQIIPNYYHLNDNKLSKTASEPTPSGNAVEYIEFMGDDIWVATTVGVSKSTNNGETWENYEFGEEGISALGINNDTIWVATWHAIESDGEVIPVGSGLHYSADKGENWTDIEQPVDESNDSSIVYGINTLRSLPLNVEEGNFTRDIGFMGNSVWIANFYGGLRVSNDVGKTWRKVVLPPDYLDSIKPSDTLNFTLSPSSGALGFENNLNHRFFSIRVVNDSTIYIGTANGINKSTDGGMSWTKFNHLNQENSISGNFILDINYDNSNNMIWAATWKAEGETEFYGLSSSADDGLNWENFLAGENIHDIAFTYAADESVNGVFVATNNGIFRSSDFGSSWLLAPEMRDDESNISLTTNNFRAVNGKLDFDGYNYLWFGSEGGTASLKETGGIWDGEWKVYLSSPDISSKSEAIAFPNPFTPDNEPVKLKYSFSGGSKSVTIRIFDFGMNLVRTVIQNVPRNEDTEYIDNWDGRDENGSLVPNGVYFFRIDIGNNDPLYGKIISLM